MGSSALPRWSGRQTLLHQGCSDAGEMGSSLSRLGVSHGTRSMPSMRSQLPSVRALSKASREGDLRENLANADMSASVHEMSVSRGSEAGMSAKPLRTKSKSASAERYLRTLGATVDMAPPHEHTPVFP
jgi:hypothetical protein